MSPGTGNLSDGTTDLETEDWGMQAFLVNPGKDMGCLGSNECRNISPAGAWALQGGAIMALERRGWGLSSGTAK